MVCKLTGMEVLPVGLFRKGGRSGRQYGHARDNLVIQRAADGRLFDSLMQHYHYLGSERPVGEYPEVSGVGAGAPDHLSGMGFGGVDPKTCRVL